MIIGDAPAYAIHYWDGTNLLSHFEIAGPRNVIASYNGFGYKTDDHGNTPATASALSIAGTTISGSGLISTRADSDYFQFTTGAGNVTLNVNPAAVGAN